MRKPSLLELQLLMVEDLAVGEFPPNFNSCVGTVVKGHRRITIGAATLNVPSLSRKIISAI